MALIEQTITRRSLVKYLLLLKTGILSLKILPKMWRKPIPLVSPETMAYKLESSIRETKGDLMVWKHSHGLKSI